MCDMYYIYYTQRILHRTYVTCIMLHVCGLYIMENAILVYIAETDR